MKIAALIPARAGSKGVPGKNFKDFCGKPLWEWTWKAAIDSKIFDEIIVSTDQNAYRFPDIVFEDTFIDVHRPAKLSDDNASLDDVLCYYKNIYARIDTWCLLVPTSPLRTAEDIKNAFEIFNDNNYDSLVSVNKADYAGDHMYWKKNNNGVLDSFPLYDYRNRMNRQDVNDKYRENGSIYITKKHILKNTRCRIGGNIGLYLMPKERSFEIDDKIDWRICEMLREGPLNE